MQARSRVLGDVALGSENEAAFCGRCSGCRKHRLPQEVVGLLVHLRGGGGYDGHSQAGQKPNRHTNKTEILTLVSGPGVTVGHSAITRKGSTNGGPPSLLAFQPSRAPWIVLSLFTSLPTAALQNSLLS